MANTIPEKFALIANISSLLRKAPNIVRELWLSERKWVHIAYVEKLGEYIDMCGITHEQYPGWYLGFTETDDFLFGTFAIRRWIHVCDLNGTKTEEFERYVSSCCNPAEFDPDVDCSESH